MIGSVVLLFLTVCICIYPSHQLLVSSRTISSLSSATRSSTSASASASASSLYSYTSNSDQSDLSSQWYSLGNCDCLLPKQRVPKSIIHFIGGFIAGSAVSIAYDNLLSELSANGHLIIATPISAFEMNHTEVAASATRSFIDCYTNHITPLIGVKSMRGVPIVGLSHSLGGKIMALICSNKYNRKLLPSRVANVYMAFNNYGMQQNLDLMSSQAARISPELVAFINALRASSSSSSSSSSGGSTGNSAKSVYSRVVSQVKDTVNTVKGSSSYKDILGFVSDVGDLSDRLSRLGDIVIKKGNEYSSTVDDTISSFNFTPTPDVTWKCIEEGYNIQRNVLLKFDGDTIDQSTELMEVLHKRGCNVQLLHLPGNHLTPNTQLTMQDVNSLKYYLQQLLAKISLQSWNDIEELESERYQLPSKSSVKWDNDNY